MCWGIGAPLRITLRSSGHGAGAGIERSATGAFVARWAAGHPQKVAWLEPRSPLAIL